MKKFALIVSLFALVSVAAHASASVGMSALERLAFTSISSNDPLPPDQAMSVREALLDVMNSTAFDCTSSTDSYDSSDGRLQAVKDFVHFTQKVYVAGSNVQPALRLVWNGLDKESTLKVNTTADYKSIVSMQAVQETVSISRVNVGTIVNPKWNIRETRTTTIEVSCAAKISI